MPDTLDLQAEARSRLEAGESTLEIVHSYPVIQDRRQVFQALVTIPVPGAFRSRRWSNRVLIAVFVLWVVTYSILLLEALILNEQILQAAVGLLGNCIVIYALIRRRPWIYIGIPFWVALMAYGNLRDFDAEGELGASFLVELFLFLLLLYAIPVWLAVRIPRSVFPFLTWRGLPRSADGTIRLPTGMDTSPGE